MALSIIAAIPLKPEALAVGCFLGAGLAATFFAEGLRLRWTLLFARLLGAGLTGASLDSQNASKALTA